MAEEQGAERTETATPKRRREVRKKGQVAKSAELNTVIMLGCGLLVMLAFSNYLISGIKNLFVYFMAYPVSFTSAEGWVKGVCWNGFAGFFKILAPVLGCTVVAAVAANVSQVGFYAATEALQPKPERLNPAEGIKRIFGKRALVEFFKGLLKIVLVGAIAYTTYKVNIGDLDRLMFAVPATIIPELIKIAGSFLVRALLALGAIAVLDYAYQRWEFEKQIRMTKQELREEFKETEGDPVLKSRIQSIQRRLARSRMMEDVKKADVVVTNPTHYSVALGYDEADVAPKVLAKGKNILAQKIRDIAREHDIPIVERPLLAAVQGM
jgi:flagellar biosynthetic protein FlhB